jgi:hypothetical protein
MKCLITALAICAVPWLAVAASPPVIPVQGVLTDANGTPLDAPVDIRFAIYDAETGGQEVWSETQNVAVQNGLFVAYLGQVNPLDLSVFKTHDDLWLGMQVGADPEMARIYLGSTPFSAYAEHSSYSAGTGISIAADNTISSTLGTSINSGEITDGTIQLDDLGQNGCSSGQIMRWSGSAWECADPAPPIPSGFCMFSTTQSSCPSGWTRAGGLDGSALRGASSPGGTGGADTHTHTTQNHTLTVAEIPSHTHSILSSNWQNGSGEGGHRQGDSTGAPDVFFTEAAGGGGAHNHGATGSADSWPPYTNVLICCKN